MNREAKRLACFAIVCFGLLANAAAEDLGEAHDVGQPGIYPQQLFVDPCSLLRSCCVPYCPKPLPHIACLGCGCCDDYCRKPEPCVRCWQGCCEPDTYCPKPFPDLCRPLFGDYFSCGE